MHKPSRYQRVFFFFVCLTAIGFARQFYVQGQIEMSEIESSALSPSAGAVGTVAANAYGDDPWKADELVQPADLAQALSGARKPIILQTGVVHLYRIGHIAGAKYAGMATTAEGLETLKKTVRDTPRDSEIVFYCGCCPMPDCPNIRPAHRTLREMGFKKIRLLNLPTNFTQDWQMKGYPVEKGGAEASQ